MVIVTLTFLTIGYFGPVLIVGAVMACIVLFHYVVWGWWLEKVLRKAAAEEEARREAELAATAELEARRDAEFR
jgi:fatty acid desaturase